MLKDFRFAFRMIAWHRWFSAAIVATLALGIGINTTVFTLVNAVLFAPVPIPGGDRLLTVDGNHLSKPNDTFKVSWKDYLEFKTANKEFEGIEALSRAQRVISEPGNPPQLYNMAHVSSGLFPLFKMNPIAGRAIAATDCVPGAEPVVLLGNSIWQDRYAGAPAVIGRTVRIDGKPATVIGIMPPGLMFPRTEEFWMPLVPDSEMLKRSNHSLELFGLVRPHTPISAANAELAALAARIAKDHPESNKDIGAVARTFQDSYMGGTIRVVFLTMLGAVGFVLLIACANVANMMLGRSIARGREFAVRAAIGATRWQLVRQVLVECIVLSVLGGACGLGLAAFGVDGFDLAMQDVGKPYWIQFRMDWEVYGYFAAITILTGVVFGLVPALRSSRVDLNSTMKNGTPGGGSHHGRLLGTLVVLQFALTVVLLSEAGLMIRSFIAAQRINAVVGSESLLVGQLQLPEGKGERYEDPATRRRFIDAALARMATLPGVTAATVGSRSPGLGVESRDIEIEGRPNADNKEPPEAGLIVEAPNYLSTLGIPLLVGRGFSDSDGDPGKEAVVVSRAFADRYWPDGSAIGKRMRLIEDNKPSVWMSVIGICADIEMQPGEANPLPVIHISYHQDPWGWIMGLVLRTRSDPTTLAAPLRVMVQEMDQDLPLFDTRTLTAAVAKNFWYLRVFGTLFAVFAATGLLMASVGIYATVAQNTARRTREIGIRMSLGATGMNIARLVLSRGLAQLLIGLGLGLFGAFASTRLLNNTGFLVGISAHDPAVFAAIVILLLLIGAAACWVPARKASRLAPVEALRTE
jgi:putative ABC transport system permease protein